MTFKQMLRFMITYNITETEYVLLCCMYYKNLDEDIPILIKKYAEKWGVIESSKSLMYGRDTKEKLVEKGLLVAQGNGYALTDKFLDLFVIEFTAGNEVLDLYPSFLIINNVNTPLKTGNKAELRKKYWEAIGGHRLEHQEVVKDIKYGKHNNLLNMNVNKFIEAEFWTDIRKLRLEEKETSVIPDDF